MLRKRKDTHTTMVPITFGGGGGGNRRGGRGERVQGQGTIQRFLIALLEPLAEPLEDAGEPAARRPVSAGRRGRDLGELGGGWQLAGSETRQGTVPGMAVVAGTVFLLHDGRHTVGELRPVGVQPAAPAGGEAGEEPRLLLAGPVAGALLLAGFAAARLLQPDVLHQVPPERGAPGLLDVQEHDHIAPLDVEIHEAGQVLQREVEARHEPGQRPVLRGLGVRLFFLLLCLVLLRVPQLLVLVLRRRGPPRPLGRPPGWRGQLGPSLPVLERRLCRAGGTRGGRLAGFPGAGLLPEVGAGAGAGGGHVLVHDDHEEKSEHRRQQPLVEPFIHGPALRPAG